MLASTASEDFAIGQRIRWVRARHRLSQAAIAEKLGVALRTFQNYERGDRPVTKDLLLALSQRFECDPTWLLTGRAPAVNGQILAQILAAIMAARNADDQSRCSSFASLAGEIYSLVATIADPDDLALAIKPFVSHGAPNCMSEVSQNASGPQMEDR